MINPTKLDVELKKAGIEIAGCNSDGVVWDIKNKEIQDRADVLLVLAAHDPAPDEVTIQREEYDKLGVTPDEMIYALWKKIMQSDAKDADDLQTKIDQVSLIS
ncbi:MAG: hypothetical protein MUO76_24160 [Anaerolineaceae bacterium]|nr:hypothetical protein [Anaerolineaceae bacterium]